MSSAQTQPSPGIAHQHQVRGNRGCSGNSPTTGNVYPDSWFSCDSQDTRGPFKAACQFPVVGKGIARTEAACWSHCSSYWRWTQVRVISSSVRTPRQPRMLKRFPGKVGCAVLCSLSKLSCRHDSMGNSPSPRSRPCSAMKEAPGKFLSRTKDEISTITCFRLQKTSGRFHWRSKSGQTTARIQYHQTILP